MSRTLQASWEAPTLPPWRASVLLTAGLLVWELCLWWFLTGEFGAEPVALALQLARDAAFLFPLCVAAVGGVRILVRRRVHAPATVETAALLSLLFLLMLLPVAAVRGVLQRPAEPPPPNGPTEGTVSAASRAESIDGRFLCAAVGPDAATTAAEPTDTSLLATAWAGARDALLLQVPVLPLALLLVRRRRWPRALRPALAVLALLAFLGAERFGKYRAKPGTPSPEALTQLCRPGAPVRTYALAAVTADLRLNALGDHVPQAPLYALEEELPTLLERARKGEPLPPLVLRANLGECLVLHVTNRQATGTTAPRLDGLRAYLWGSGQAGFIPGTTLSPGQRLTYVLPLPESPSAEGTYLLQDAAEEGVLGTRGRFGALVLEPAGAVYRNASTGEPLPHGAGWEALIDVPSGESFRELVLLYHSMGTPKTADVRAANGALLPVLDEMAGLFRPGAFGINYRSEPRFERAEYFPEESETLPLFAAREPVALLRSYVGERVKLRLVHAGNPEFHIHHLHEWDERWAAQEKPSRAAPPEELWLLGPGLSATVLAGEPSGFPRRAGDYLLHCHVPNHTLGGERLTWRVFDARQPDLAPLPGAALSVSLEERRD